MSLVVCFRYQNYEYYKKLELGEEISFGSHSSDTVYIPDTNEHALWLKANSSDVQVEAIFPFQFPSEIIRCNELILLNTQLDARIYISHATGRSSKTVTVPHDGKITVGRSKDNDVILSCLVVSRHHFQLSVKNGTVSVEDLGSTNGLFLNGKRITRAFLRSGDVLSILTFRFVYENGNLCFENVENFLQISNNVHEYDQEPVFPSKTPIKENRKDSTWNPVNQSELIACGYLICLEVGDEYLYKKVIQESDKITFGTGKKDDVYVPSFTSKQFKVSISKGRLVVSGHDVAKKNISIGERAELNSRLKIAISSCIYYGKSSQTFEIPYDGLVKIGRSNDNNIIFNNMRVSGTHLTIICQDGRVRLEDGYKGRKSLNGTYVNGRRASILSLKSGDIIDIQNYRLILINKTLSFENVGNDLQLNAKSSGDISIKDIERRKDLLYRRAPRERKALPDKEIVLSKAPSPKGGISGRRRGMWPSLISSGAMMAVMFASGGMFSPALIAARAAGMATPLASMAMYGGENKKSKKEAEKAKKEFNEKYGAYIEAQYAVINQVAEQQRRIITEENPEPKVWIESVKKLYPKLWERRPGDSDFLNVRVGMGYEDICVNIKSPSETGFMMEQDEAQELIKQLIEATRIVDNIPARVNLKKYKTIGIVGKRPDTINLVRDMLISLTASHYYEDVRLVGIFDKEEEKIWRSLRWLPHVWDEEKQNRFLAFDSESAEKLCETLYEIIHQRLSVRESYDQRVPTPYYIFIIGSYKYVKKSKLLGELVRNAEMAGASTIFALNPGNLESEDSRYQMSYLPNECQYVIDTEGEHGSPSSYEFACKNRGFMFTMDPKVNDQSFDEFCRIMSAVNVIGGAGKMELPTGITFLEGMGITNANKIDVWSRWTNMEKEQQLGGNIGVMANGKHLSLDIGDFNQPPISLVAGMSGSGKSEFLKTWILSMALNYSPDELEFVIIDYKGGSMAASVEGLPHVAGKITNIESGDIMRPLVSLSYEIQRREWLLSNLGILDYKQYYKKFLSGEVKEALPIMVIMCDEFAELKLQHREFMTELVRIARLGRSLGIRLVLATQSPAGVVDQDLFDNSRYQICLKVQNSAASKSMIARPDAARLTQNGRAYVRAGADEIFELVQSYWTGAPYFGYRDQKASIGNQVRLVEMNGERINTVHEEKTRFKSDTDELKAVIRVINKTAREHDIDRRPCPWKPELPQLLKITEMDVKGGFDGADWRPGIEWLKIPIGMYDVPEAQRQGIQYIDFSKEGHYGIYGLPGSGKKTILKTIVMQLGMYYKPSDVNIYILDMGGHTLRMFEKMPHVAGIAVGSDSDKMQKIANAIAGILADRKKEFARCAISSLKNYREHISQDMPAIFLVIENFMPLFEICPEFEDLIYKLGSEGVGYGIYMVYTANSTNGIRYKLTQNIYSGIAFEMIDKASYNEAVGRVSAPEKLAKIKGRGFFKSNDGPTLFQAAVYGEGETEIHWQAWVKNQVELMNLYWDGPEVEIVKSLPDVLRAEDLYKTYTQRDMIPVGLDCQKIETAYLDFTKESAALIIGDEITDNTAMLAKITKLIAAGEYEQKLFLIDDDSGTLTALSPLCEKYVRSDDLKEVDGLLKDTIQELIVRENQMKREAPEDVENLLQNFPQLCLIIANLKDFIECISNDDGAYKRMNALVKNVHGLGGIIIAAADSANINELQLINGIVSKLVQCQNVLALSGTPVSHSCFQKNNLSYEEKTSELKDGKGMIYSGGNAVKIMLIE